jgi:twitching motility protein PilI
MGDAVTGAGAITGKVLFDALRDLERRCLERGAGLPKQEASPEIWAGVLFRISDVPLLSPLEEVSEVLEVPRDITSVPGAKPWVRGVANNRGTLLPIFDIQALLFGASITRNPRNRVLVARQEELPYGLLVSEVVGIRHFEVSARIAEVRGVRGELADVVVGGFALGAERYAVFSPKQLGLDARFRLAAA